MANRYRGEISAVLDGNTHNLCLTLGALAELETLFGVEDMVALATRFENGRISARDAQRIIGAGLRAGGADISDEMVAGMKVEGGAAGYVEVVARLLQATFGSTDVQTNVAPKPPTHQSVSGNPHQPPKEGGETRPFLGTTS